MEHGRRLYKPSILTAPTHRGTRGVQQASSPVVADTPLGSPTPEEGTTPPRDQHLVRIGKVVRQTRWSADPSGTQRQCAVRLGPIGRTEVAQEGSTWIEAGGGGGHDPRTVSPGSNQLLLIL